MSYINTLIVSLIGLFLFQNLDAQIGIVNQFDEGDRWSKKIAQVDEFIHYINFDGLSSSQENESNNWFAYLMNRIIIETNLLLPLFSKTACPSPNLLAIMMTIGTLKQDVKSATKEKWKR
ncbi:MAG: hypothetical protein ACPG49_07995 [Chitinophagales bacterium]